MTRARVNTTAAALQVGDQLPYYGHREVVRVVPAPNDAVCVHWKDAGKEGRGDPTTTYWGKMTIVVEREVAEEGHGKDA